MGYVVGDDTINLNTENLKSGTMDYEKKKTLAVLKQIVADGKITQADVEKYCPEIKESEDEKIRKELLIDIPKVFPHDKAFKYIAWVEKQSEHANFRNKIQIGDKVTRNKDGVLVNLSQLKRVAKPADEKQNKQKHFCKLDNSYTHVKFPFKAKVKSSGKIITIHDGQLSFDGKEWIKYQSDAEDGYKVYEPNNLELVCEIEQNHTWNEEDL